MAYLATFALYFPSSAPCWVTLFKSVYLFGDKVTDSGAVSEPGTTASVTLVFTDIPVVFSHPAEGRVHPPNFLQTPERSRCFCAR